MLQQRGVPYPEIRYSDRHLADAEDISLRLSFRIRPVPVRIIASGWREGTHLPYLPRVRSHKLLGGVDRWSRLYWAHAHITPRGGNLTGLQFNLFGAECHSP